MWISSPLAIAFAQKFLPAETWVVWFNLVRYVDVTFDVDKKLISVLCLP